MKKEPSFDLSLENIRKNIEIGISAETQISINGSDFFIKFPSTIKDEYMECVTIHADLEKGKNTITFNGEKDKKIHKKYAFFLWLPLEMERKRCYNTYVIGRV